MLIFLRYFFNFTEKGVYYPLLWLFMLIFLRYFFILQKNVCIILFCGSKHVPSNLNDTGRVIRVYAAIDPSIAGLTTAVA